MINKVCLFMLISIITFNHTNSVDSSSFHSSEIKKETLRTQFLLLPINFNERKPRMFSISFRKPYAYYKEDFKKLIETSNQLLDEHHQISKKLQRLYKKIDNYWYTNSNYYANNLDALYAEEEVIKYLYHEILNLIHQL